jgi:hypothetical protein
MCKSKKPGLKKPMKKDLIKGTSQPFEASVVVKPSAFSGARNKQGVSEGFNQFDGNSHHHEQKVVPSGVF